MEKIYDPIFKLDSVGRLRVWYMQVDGPRYRTYSGLQGGNLAVSDWTTAIPASKDTAEEQAVFEVEARYEHQLKREYHRDVNDVSKPNIIEPMLAKTYDGYSGACFVQPKLDGMRCIATAEGLFSREGQPIASSPHIFEALAPVFAEDPDIILDGEIYNHDLKDDFQELMSIARKKKPTPAQLRRSAEALEYHVYDVVSVAGDIEARLNYLKEVVARSSLKQEGPIKFVPTAKCQNGIEIDAMNEQFLEAGYEGQMVRLSGYEYQRGRRSRSLLKRKEFETAEFPLLRLEEGRGNWSGAAKRGVFQLEDGAECGAGIRGTYAKGVQLLSLSITSKTSATVRFFGRSKDNVPRFPVIIDIHPDGRKD